MKTIACYKSVYHKRARAQHEASKASADLLLWPRRTPQYTDDAAILATYKYIYK